MIPSVGKPKIVYKDHQKVDFESLDFYLTLAKKIISKMGSKCSSLSKQMLKDEDAISFVANSIMMGDWRWKNEDDYKDGEKKYKTLYSYRNQCGIWAIKTYSTKKFKDNQKEKILSINYENETNDTAIENLIKDTKQKSPVSILIDRETQNETKELINKILDSGLLNDKQADYIRLYFFEKLTLEKIGKKYGVTREAIRQNIKLSLQKIRDLA